MTKQNSTTETPLALNGVVTSRHGQLTRTEIEAAINRNNEAVEKLEAENLELRKQAILLSDETQRFEEKEEEHIVSKRPKKTEKLLVGRIHWKEDFKDEDTGEVISIERSQVVRVNGEWR